MAEDFAERLRELRLQRKLTQTQLGELAGLHYNHIGRFERSGSRPTADTLRKLSDALGVSSDYLLDGVTEEGAKAKFEDRELLRQFQEVERLPDEDKAVIKKLVEAFLIKKQLHTLIAR